MSNITTGDLTGHEQRARARARAAEHEAEYAPQRPQPEQVKPQSDPLVWNTDEYRAAAVHDGQTVRSFGSQAGDKARAMASMPLEQAKARARADDRAERDSKRQQARLAGYMRGGIGAQAYDDGRGLSHIGFALPFVRNDAERDRYAGFWLKLDAFKLDGAARRAARSVRAGRVSDTSRDEAAAAARASLIQSAVALAPIHLSHAIDRVCQSPVCLADAASCARTSLRGEASGGVKARNGELTGRAVSNDDGNGGLVWSIEKGDWITVTRADGATAYDLAGRIVCEERGSIDDDDAARTWALDAVRLVGWLVRLRLARLAGERGAAVAPCVRTRIRSAASKVARVLRAIARGESLAAACEAVGFSLASECRAWRKAVSALTDGRGLADAMRDFRASVAA